MAKKPLSTVTFAITDTLGVVQEDGTLQASGPLIPTDSMASATPAWSAGNNGVAIYGDLELPLDSSWRYAPSNASAKVQALAAGQLVTDSFTIKVTDSVETVATQLGSINIIDVSDAPVITFAAGKDDGAMQEDVGTRFYGTLKGTHPDAGTVLAWTVDGGGVGQYDSLIVSSAGPPRASPSWSATARAAAPAR
jgi:VCBS repeat-containing protein